MGTTLTGTTPQDTYDSLIKVTNNGPLSSTARYLSDGLGNDSVLALSTSRVGVGTASPDLTLHLYNSAAALAYFESTSANGAYVIWRNSGTSIGDVGSQLGISGSGSASNFMIASRSGDMILGSSSAERMRITSAGNVGIGTSSPESKLHIAGTASGSDVTLYIDNVAASTLNNSTRLKFSSDSGSSVSSGGAELNCTIVDAGNGAVDLLVKSWSGGAYTEKARFLAGGGLTFNGDTAAANALDDYEEGTWTPVYAGGITGATYSNTVGKYTKIGNAVHWSCRIQASAGTAAATALTIGGFPFTNSATVETAGSIGFFTVYTTDSVYMYNVPSTTSIAAFYNLDGTALLGTELTSVTGTIHCSGTYFV